MGWYGDKHFMIAMICCSAWLFSTLRVVAQDDAWVSEVKSFIEREDSAHRARDKLDLTGMGKRFAAMFDRRSVSSTGRLIQVRSGLFSYYLEIDMGDFDVTCDISSSRRTYFEGKIGRRVFFSGTLKDMSSDFGTVIGNAIADGAFGKKKSSSNVC